MENIFGVICIIIIAVWYFFVLLLSFGFVALVYNALMYLSDCGESHGREERKAKEAKIAARKEKNT